MNRSLNKQQILRVFAYFLFFIFAFLVTLRNSMYISDGPNYIQHSLLLDIDFSDPQIYGYFLYWLIVDIFGNFFGEQFPSFLSFVIFFILFLIIRNLSTKNIFIFILFLILNPLIFNSMFVALKNGLALSVLMYGIISARESYIISSIGFHPGVTPLSIIIIYFNKDFSVFIKALLLIIGVFIIFYTNVSNEILESRGYDEYEAGKELWFVYAIYFLLGVFYYFSFKLNIYKYFFIALVLFWIIIGNYYPFAWRIFAQSLVLALLILLINSDRWLGKYSFLSLFFLLSIYSAYEFHPLIDYSEGWLSYWLSFV